MAAPPPQTPGCDPGRSPPAMGERPSPVIWYEHSELKRRHRELVKVGMERSRQLGKRIGRPPVTEREGFPQRFAEVVEHIGPGGLSLRQAAQELEIGFATLQRLLDARVPPDALRRTSAAPTPAAHNGDVYQVHEVTDNIAQH